MRLIPRMKLTLRGEIFVILRPKTKRFLHNRAVTWLLNGV